MPRITRWAGALLMLVSVAVSAQGKGYTTLETPQSVAGSGVEVKEFFSYACPHCFSFHPLMESWLKKAPEQVNYVPVPVVFSEAWKPYALAYHAAATLAVLDKIHDPLFNALHVEKRKLRTTDDLIGFFAEHGVDKEKAAAAFRSFPVDMAMRKSAQALRDYRIDSTPTVVVNGKYVVTPRTAGGQQQMVDVIDHLVRQELAAKK